MWKNTLFRFDMGGIYPFALWISTKKNEKLKKHFKINPDDTELPINSHQGATTYCVYEIESNQIGILIAFNSKKQMHINNIAHEARHAGDMLFELIGENPHHSEAAAYFTGWVAECTHKIKKHNGKTKKC